MYSPTIDSYFSGIGGLDYGLTEGGCTIKRSLEYDQHCANTLRANFTHEVVQDDIRNRTALDHEPTDAIALTFPCTKYSPIADIHGTRTGDELFLHGFRHVALRKPEAFVLENVPGMRKFKVVMECFTKIPDYYVQVFCPLDAANWLPQKRERLIVIATRKPFSISAPGRENPIQLKDIIERDAEIHIPDYVFSRLNGKYRDLPIISDPDSGDIAPTCVAHYSKDLSTRMIRDGKRVRPYTVREYARLQGFPDSFQFSGMGRWVGQQLHKYFNRSNG